MMIDDAQTFTLTVKDGDGHDQRREHDCRRGLGRIVHGRKDRVEEGARQEKGELREDVYFVENGDGTEKLDGTRDAEKGGSVRGSSSRRGTG